MPDLGDLGNGTPSDDGRNSIHSHSQYAVNSNGAVLKAENNWWGASPPNPTWFSAGVDYDPWLSSPPPQLWWWWDPMNPQ